MIERVRKVRVGMQYGEDPKACAAFVEQFIATDTDVYICDETSKLPLEVLDKAIRQHLKKVPTGSIASEVTHWPDIEPEPAIRYSIRTQ